MGNATISIVIPYYNNKETIEETINSIRAQELAPDEVVIINDGSSKGDSDFLIEITKETDYKIVTQDNFGPSTARNNAIKFASSDYIVFLDSDDLIEPKGILRFHEEIKNKPEVDVFVPKVKQFGDKSGMKNTMIPNVYQILRANPLTICVCCKKSVFTDGYFFKEEMNRIGLEDWEWWINIISDGKKLCLINELLFKIRVHDSSRTYSTANNQLNEAKKLIFGFHGDVLHEYYIYLFLENRSLKNSPYFRLKRKVKKLLKYGKKRID